MQEVVNISKAEQAEAEKLFINLVKREVARAAVELGQLTQLMKDEAFELKKPTDYTLFQGMIIGSIIDAINSTIRIQEDKEKEKKGENNASKV